MRCGSSFSGWLLAGQKTRVPKSGKPGIRRLTTADGFLILVGRNA
jgi:hypothetical protein